MGYNTYTQNLVFSSSSSQSATISTGFENISVSIGDLFVSSSSGPFEGIATLTFYNNSDMADDHIVYVAQMQLASNTLSTSASAGASIISLSSAAGFSAYNQIQILTDGTNPTERRRVAASGVSVNNLSLIDTLAHNHNSASVVANLAEFGGIDLEDASFTSGNMYVSVSFPSAVSVTLTLEVSGINISASASGANTSLSNLTNPTAVNQPINMSGNAVQGDTVASGILTLSGTSNATAGYVVSGPDGTLVSLGKASLEAITSGNVGINSPLTVSSYAVGSDSRITMNWSRDNSANFGIGLAINRTRGTFASPTSLLNGDGTNIALVSTYDGSSIADTGIVQIVARASEDQVPSSNLGTALDFFITPNGQDGFSSTNMTLDGTGLIMYGSQIHQVADPTSAQDAATKNYVDTHTPATSTLSQILTAGNNATGQSIVGDTVASGVLTLAGTSNATPGYLVVGPDGTLASFGKAALEAITSPNVGLNGPLTVSSYAVGSDSRITMNWARDNSANFGIGLAINRSRGTFASPTSLLSGDGTNIALVSTYDGSSIADTGTVQIAARATEDYVAGSNCGTALDWYITPNGQDGFGSSNMTLDGNGLTLYSNGITLPNISGASVVTPPSGYQTLFFDSDNSNQLARKDETGTVTLLG